MTQVEIMQGLGRLSTSELLQVIEAALRLLQRNLEAESPLIHLEKKQRLAAAAQMLLPDYTAGGELTAFTVLDSEGFYA